MARIVAAGFVEPHDARPGVRCTFTRTANNGPDEAKEEARRAAVLARAKDPVELERRRLVQLERQAAIDRADARKAEVELQRAANKKRGRAAEAVRRAAMPICEKCGERVNAIKSTGVGLRAHKRPSGLWCKGGAAPTDAQRNKGKARRSVHTVSGGLPGQGRRS